MDNRIQGYIPTVTLRGKRKFAKFDGGLTSVVADAMCEPHDDAWEIAQIRARQMNTLFAVPGVIGVCGQCAGLIDECECQHGGEQ